MTALMEHATPTRPDSSAKGWSLLVAQLRPARRELAILAVGSIVAGAPTFASGLVVSRAIDRGFLAGRPVTGLWWLAALAVLGVLGAFTSSALLPVMARLVEPMRDRLARVAVHSGLSYVVGEDSARDGAGALAVRATEHVEGVRGLVIALLRSAFGMVFTIVLAVAGLTALVPQVALAMLPFVVLGLTGYVLVVRRLMRRQRALLLAEERVGEQSRLLLTAQRDIIAFGAADAAFDSSARGAITDSMRAGRAANRLGWWRSLIPAAAIQAPVLVLLALAPWLIEHASLSPGDLVGGVIYIVRGLAPAIGFLVSGGAGWLVQLGLLLERLASQPVPETNVLKGQSAAPGPLHLHARDLAFRYSPHAAPVLTDAELSLPLGTHLALVGPSGVGKSTLAALLSGVRSPQSGTVTLGGVPLAEWPVERLRRSIAYVPQEAYIFAGTVRENLCYLSPAAESSQVEESVRRFGLQRTVERLGGLEGGIAAGGDGLSAGERQLIALARTWLSPAEVVFLDEAACHLDPAAEESAERELRRRGGTLVVVAHRISSALRAERVAVVESGQIRSGTHTELLKSSQSYARLVGYWQATVH